MAPRIQADYSALRANGSDIAIVNEKIKDLLLRLWGKMIGWTGDHTEGGVSQGEGRRSSSQRIMVISAPLGWKGIPPTLILITK